MKKSKNAYLPKSVAEHIEWLENRLIKDLKDSGQIYTAQSFEKCVRMIKKAYRRKANPK